jgi:hypothetical protein
MKRLLVAFLLVTLLVMGTAAVSAQIEQQAVITPTNAVYAAWQPFENGVMMWWSDLDQIWVLINPTNSSPGFAYIYEDTWNGETISSGTPPAGRFGAIRGFGKVWSYLGGGTGQLGWAYAPELGYDSAARSVSNGVITIKGPGDTRYRVTFIPTGQANTYAGVGVFEVLDFG